MGTIQGNVTRYESSDGGRGCAEKTVWQFFVAGRPVTTENYNLAETMRLAIKTSNQVTVTFDDTTNVMSQARLDFSYICEAREIVICRNGEPEPPTLMCETKRYNRCEVNPG